MIKSTMDILPCEILIKIIEQLPLKQISKCRCVCRKWKSSIDNNLRLDDLIIGEQMNPLQPDFHRWYFTQEPVESYNWIEKLDTFQRLVHLPMLKNLKQLYIHNATSQANFCSTISNLKQLQRLELHQVAIKEANFILSLPHLNSLIINEINVNAITLDTCNLTHLRINSSHCHNLNLKFNYPTSVRHLELSAYQPIAGQSFANLELLYCNEMDYPLDASFLTNLPKLREIHFNQSHRNKNDVFNYLKTAVQTSKRTNLEIYNFGMKLSNLPTMKLEDGSTYANNNTTQYICYNYEKLASRVPFITGIDYSVLAHHFDEVPMNFSRKFLNIDTVKIESKINANQLVKFLQNYRNLKCLHLNYSSLKSRFFNILPALCPYLLDLIINENHVASFEFILKFKNLFSLDTNQDLSVDLVRRVFEQTSMQQMFFCYQREYLAITGPEEGGIYKFGLASEEPDEFASRDELFAAFDEMLLGDQYENYLEEEMCTDEDESSMEVDDDEVMSQDMLHDNDDDSTISFDEDAELDLSVLSDINESSSDFEQEIDDSLDLESISSDIEVIFDSDDEDQTEDASTIRLDDIEVIFSDSDLDC